MIPPDCPICGWSAEQKYTQYGVRNSCCGLWSWGDAPLVDEETHEARKAAHEAFDTLWKDHGISRSSAYAQLAAALGIKPEDCHMKKMDKMTASRVPDAVMAILRDDDIGLIE